MKNHDRPYSDLKKVLNDTPSPVNRSFKVLNKVPPEITSIVPLQND